MFRGCAGDARGVLYGCAVIWEPDFIARNADSIAHHIAQRSKLTERELLEVILEPFDIGFDEPDPGDWDVGAGERTLERGCDAIRPTAREERRKTLGGFPR